MWYVKNYLLFQIIVHVFTFYKYLERKITHIISIIFSEIIARRDYLQRLKRQILNTVWFRNNYYKNSRSPLHESSMRTIIIPSRSISSYYAYISAQMRLLQTDVRFVCLSRNFQQTVHGILQFKRLLFF